MPTIAPPNSCVFKPDFSRSAYHARPNPADRTRAGPRRGSSPGSRAHDRRIIDGRRRIAPIVHDPQAELLGILARADEHIVREFGVGADQRDGLGAG